MKELKTRVPDLVILLLVLIAIFLGYKIFQTISSANKAVDLLPTPQVSSSINITSAEKNYILTSTYTKLPDSGKKKLTSLVQKAAVLGNTVKLGADCVSSPLVLKVRKGVNLKIVNIDKLNHNFGLNNKSFPIKAGATQTISTDNFVTGMYRDGCDSKISGYIIVI